MDKRGTRSRERRPGALTRGVADRARRAGALRAPRRRSGRVRAQAETARASITAPTARAAGRRGWRSGRSAHPLAHPSSRAGVPASCSRPTAPCSRGRSGQVGSSGTRRARSRTRGPSRRTSHPRSRATTRGRGSQRIGAPASPRRRAAARRCSRVRLPEDEDAMLFEDLPPLGTSFDPSFERTELLRF